MSKASGQSDVLLLGALAVGALFLVGRARSAYAAGTTPRFGFGPQRVGNVGGMSNGGFTGLMTGSLLGSMLRGSASPDLLQAGATGGSTGTFFSDIAANDNANAAVQSQVGTDLLLGGGAVPVNVNWGQWGNQSSSQFTMPDLTNPMQDAYAGFDNPANYG
jgi:hypothetical protein